METSLDESMDADRASPSPQDSQLQTSPAINGKPSVGGIGSQDGINGVAIANEKANASEVQW